MTCFFTIIEPLGPPPGEDANQAEHDALNMIFNMMDPNMRGFWETIDSDEIIYDPKEIFETLVSLMKHDCLDEFLSCKMTKHTSVGMHLAKMNKIHKCLTVELEYEMTGTFAKSMVMRSLPPSYRGFIESFVKRKEAVNFHQLLGRIRLTKWNLFRVTLSILKVYLIYNIINVS
jgi:hypothetical protein